MNQPLHHHYKLYKPYGFVSQFVSRQHKSYKKKFLGEFFDFHPDTMSVGRLDENSEGLLLLTTDGKLSHTINSSGVEKEYYAQVDGLITSVALLKIRKGVVLSIEGKSYQTKPCKAKIMEAPNLPETTQRMRHEGHGPTSWVSITLTEGKFRQVRKMTAAVGFPTLRLARYRVGNYTIDGMLAGDCIPVEELLP